MRHDGRLTVGRRRGRRGRPSVRRRLEVASAVGPRRRGSPRWSTAPVPSATYGASADPFLDDLLAAGSGDSRDRWVSAWPPTTAGSSTRAARARHRSGRSVRCVAASCGRSTAVPEIRGQAAASRRGARGAAPRRQPASATGAGPATSWGCRSRTTAEAAAAYNRGLDAVMRVQSGAAEAFAEAVRLDPGFALAHARAGDARPRGRRGDVDVRRSLQAAAARPSSTATERERSLVAVVGAPGPATAAARRREGADAARARAPARRARGERRGADHRVLRRHRRPAGGVGPGRGARAGVRRPLVVPLAARLRPAGPGALRRGRRARREVLALEPAAGPRRARADPRVLRDRRPHWPACAGSTRGSPPAAGRPPTARTSPGTRRCTSCRPATSTRSAGATPSQLAPPVVTGVRGLVDSASLLWRCKVTDSWRGHAARRRRARRTPGAELVERPETPFTAMHSAVALTAAGDATPAGRLRAHAAVGVSDPVLREVVAPLCDGLLAVAESAVGRRGAPDPVGAAAAGAGRRVGRRSARSSRRRCLYALVGGRPAGRGAG